METKNLCLECGKSINLEDYDEFLDIPQLMKNNQWCFSCAFWYKIHKEDQQVKESGKKVVLITPEYEHYIIQLETLMINMGTFRSYILESTGKCVALNEKGSSRVIISTFNNWTFQGNIPESCRKLFNPNGIFLTPEQFKDWRNRKSFTSEDLKNYMDSYIK